jgi:hypothetical protein
MNIGIVGGCFTDQHNIPFERLYHQSLKRLLITTEDRVEIRKIRYERISRCVNKVIDFHDSYSLDLLIFHLRAEPIMRLSKLYYKYLDHEKKLKHSINFPPFNLIYPEKYDLLLNRQICSQVNNNLDESGFHHMLREANYTLGSLIGNKKYAFDLLEKSIIQISQFCASRNVKFLLLGPVSRPFSRFENNISEEMDRRFVSLSAFKSINYLSLLKVLTSDGRSMFFENGIHVSQEGHDEIAQMIFDKIVMNRLSDMLR